MGERGQVYSGKGERRIQRGRGLLLVCDVENYLRVLLLRSPFVFLAIAVDGAPLGTAPPLPSPSTLICTEALAIVVLNHR